MSTKTNIQWADSKGLLINLKHSHGGRWDEWLRKPDLKPRESPAHFHQYRQRKDTNK